MSDILGKRRSACNVTVPHRPDVEKAQELAAMISKLHEVEHEQMLAHHDEKRQKHGVGRHGDDRLCHALESCDAPLILPTQQRTSEQVAARPSLRGYRF